MRIVVKVGSSSISGANTGQMLTIVDAIASARKAGHEIILVSSGAIASGIPVLQLQGRPTDLATQQAAAAVGQNILIGRWQAALDFHKVVAGQILLTTADLGNTKTRANAGRAMETMLGMGVIPIVNENDTVATDEIRFGDNDKLAALVAELMDADHLLLLSDVDALYDRPPSVEDAKPINFVAYGDALEDIELGAVATDVGLGGAVTKVAAARYAAEHGITAQITAAAYVQKALAGDRLGTIFESNPNGHPGNPTIDKTVTAQETVAKG